MTSEYIPRSLAELVRARARGCCEYCQLPQALQAASFHIDHIWPRSLKGLTTADNLALLCVGCSLRKSNRTHAVDPRTRRRVQLFHPRRDIWSRHFVWLRTYRLQGRTAVGRATIVALGLNHSRMIAIRRYLADLGEFPPS